MTITIFVLILIIVALSVFVLVQEWRLRYYRKVRDEAEHKIQKMLHTQGLPISHEAYDQIKSEVDRLRLGRIALVQAHQSRLSFLIGLHEIIGSEIQKERIQ